MARGEAERVRLPQGATRLIKEVVLAALIGMVAIGNGGLNDVRETTLQAGATRLVRPAGENVSTVRPLRGVQLDDTARTWAHSYSIRPGRVEAVAGRAVASRTADGLEYAAAARGRPGSVVEPWRAIICAEGTPWPCFRQGYRDFGGNPEWEDRFVDVIDTCESRDYGWADTYELYISRAQFHPDSWATAVSATKLNDPADPYHVGGNVAVWSNATDPGGSGGWPGCWGEGVVP